jgi:WS/DGAT/MGAT family acyltransferase
MTTFVSPMDSIYLWGESGANPAHVIALQLFAPPASGGPNVIERLYGEMTDPSRVKPEFRRRPHRSLGTAGQYTWVDDDELDMTVQVRRVGLPAPGRIRELLEYVSSFHAVRLDRDRPLWEAHLVEGLSDGRFALCTKMHHALFDGVTMGRHLLGGLSGDPDDRTGTAPWIIPAQTRDGRPRSRTSVSSLLRRAWTAIEVPAKLAGSTKALVQAGVSVARDGDVAVPFSAPMTIFNGTVSSARRFAGQQWPTERLRAISRAAEVSTNDVALALCAGALRTYLLEQEALPDSSLVAMVPMSFRPRTDDGSQKAGNNWGAVLCPLGTDVADPMTRLRNISRSMSRNKALMSELDSNSAALLSAANLGGVVLNMVPGLPLPPRPPFNLIISNVPAGTRTLYLDGCRLTDAYPVSVVSNGQALNITLVSYAGQTAFGITGCRRSVPHLQHLLKYLDAAFVEFEEALGLTDQHEKQGSEASRWGRLRNRDTDDDQSTG